MKGFIFILAILSCGVDAGWVVEDGQVKNPVFKKIALDSFERERIRQILIHDDDEGKKSSE